MKTKMIMQKATGAFAAFALGVAGLCCAMALSATVATAADDPVVYPAPLTGWSADAGIEGLAQGLADEYSVKVTKNAVGSNTDYDLELTANGLQYHINANGTYAYWIGVSMPESFGTTYYLFRDYDSTKDYESDLSGNLGIMEDSDDYNVITLDNDSYDAFYFGNKAMNTRYDWVIVQKNDDAMTSYHLHYSIAPSTKPVTYLDMDDTQMSLTDGDTSCYAGYPDDWTVTEPGNTTTVRVTLPTPVRSGCTFLGWSLVGGDDTLYAGGSVYAKTMSVTDYAAFTGYTFKANWQIDTDYSYTFDSALKVTITGYLGTDSELIIPSTMGGFDVKNIADNAFKGNTAITSVYLIGDIESIGDSAFSGCTSLTSFRSFDSVGDVGDYAFSDCTSLARFTAGVTGIGDFAFKGCSALSSIELAGNIDDVGEFPFYGCDALADVTISGRMSEITAATFMGCDSIRSLVVSGVVDSIGDKAFFGLGSLTMVNISGAVGAIGNYAFCNCDNLSSLSIGQGSVSIGKGAFSGCEKVRTLLLPDSVTTVDSKAFSGCSGLRTVTLGKGIKTFFADVFKDCANIKTAKIKCGVTKKVGQAFADAKSFTLNIDSTGKIDSKAFKGVTGLSSLTVGSNVTALGKSAFKDCVGLKSVTLGKKVKSIGGAAFSNCPKLEILKCRSKKLKSFSTNVLKGDKALKKIYVKTAKAKRLFARAVKKSGSNAVIKKI